jgi:hypothetical protein
VDLSGDAINGAFSGSNFSLASSVLVRELQLAKNAHYVLQWWTTMPRLLVALDLSDINVAGDIPLFDALSKSLRTLTGSIALQSLSIARVSVRGKPAQLKAFTDLLAALLVNDFVRLKTLDITGMLPYLHSVLRTLFSERLLLLQVAGAAQLDSLRLVPAYARTARSLRCTSTARVARTAQKFSSLLRAGRPCVAVSTATKRS